MMVTPGTRLHAYEIVAPLGAGGMGEVYKARDTRLDRTVAIKVLSASLGGNPQFRERFDREARAISQLDHPHICTLYDVGEQDGTPFLVMQYLEGETLEARLKRRRLPLDETLRYAIQIADALDSAHRAGIVHRDLKPGNIMLTNAGAKLLDFGLAKAAAPPVNATGGLSMLQTTPPGLTAQGSIVGTFQYMAPEQLEGHEADQRTDIFAFGTIVYEMITGKKAFAGKSQASLISAIMSSDPPPIGTSQPLTPPALDRVVKKCLEKAPSERWQSAKDLGDELRWIADAGSDAGVPAQKPKQHSRRWPGAIVAAALIVAATMGWGLWWRATGPIERSLIRLDVDLGPDVALAAIDSGNPVSISPDGTRLAYAASVSGGPTRLFTRRLDQPQAVELPVPEAVALPFFSPDGQWIGFRTLRGLSKISVDGGAAVQLSDPRGVAGASWGRDGSIIVGGRGLARIGDEGGTPTQVTQLAGGELFHSLPQILPKGKAVLFTATRASASVDTDSIEVVSLDNPHRKVLVRGGAAGRYMPSGHLVYGNRGTLFAILFDPDRLEVHGKAVPVLDGVAYNRIGVPEFDVSDGGTLIYRRGGSERASRLSTLDWLDGSGRTTPLRAVSGVYGWPSFSPDGTRLAFSVATEQGTRDIWIYDWQRDTMTPLTVGGAYNLPVWTPNGRYLVFGAGAGGLFWTRTDGAGQPQPLTQSRVFLGSPTFTPDGKRLVYVEPAGTVQRIWSAAVDDHEGQLRAGTPELFLEVPNVAGFAMAVLSPDGRWLAYHSSETGRIEVYVRAFPAPSSGPGGKWLISNAGGVFPIWSRTSRELFYQSADQIMAASYAVNGDAFAVEKPRVWIAKLGGVASDLTRPFDVAPDGKRLAVLRPVEPVQAAKGEHEVVFVQNFFDELRRRVPTK
jgi:serine/threonine-protein kinase